MKHAGDVTLDALEPLLEALRSQSGIVERKRGVFYRKSQAFLHFHEDPSGLFCDVRLNPAADFERYPVTTAKQQHDLATRVAKALDQT